MIYEACHCSCSVYIEWFWLFLNDQVIEVSSKTTDTCQESVNLTEYSSVLNTYNTVWLCTKPSVTDQDNVFHCKMLHVQTVEIVVVAQLQSVVQHSRGNSYHGHHTIPQHCHHPYLLTLYLFATFTDQTVTPCHLHHAGKVVWSQPWPPERRTDVTSRTSDYQLGHFSDLTRVLILN